MSGYQNDEEQLEALKTWWKENGTSLITGVIVVLAVFFGVRQWQGSQQAQAGLASDLYQQIANLSLDSLSATISEDQLLAVQANYSRLKNEFPDSIYVRYAALALAKFHAELDQLDEAAAELQWILDNPQLGLFQEADPELAMVARLRLARIRLAQGQADTALELISAVEPGTFITGFAELEGDILLSQGRRDEARLAYLRALASNTEGNPGLLQLKLQDLGSSLQESL